MKRSLMRVGAGAAAIALATAPGLATAQTSVDKATGPVAYAVPSAYKTADGNGGMLLRSPLEPGAKKASGAVENIAVDPEKNGTTWYLQVNQIGCEGGVVPDGATCDEEYRATAALTDTLAPEAHLRSDFAIEATNTSDYTGPGNQALVYFDNMASVAACPTIDKASAATDVEKIWVRHANGQLRQIQPPVYAGKRAVVEGVPVSTPDMLVNDIPEAPASADEYANISIKWVTNLKDLTGLGDFRLGDVNASAGWRVDIQHYWVGADGAKHNHAKTTVWVGAVSCSVPSDFQPQEPPKNSDGRENDGSENSQGDTDAGNGAEDGGSADDGDETQVPVHIPSGGAPVGGDTGWLLGAGAAGAFAIGSAGVLTYRRRRMGTTAD